MSSKKKRSKKQPGKQTESSDFRQWLTRSFIYLVISGLFTAVPYGIYQKHTNVMNAFTILDKRVDVMANSDLMAYTTCKTFIGLEPRKKLSAGQIKEIELLSANIGISLTELVRQHRSMGKLVSPATYLSIHELTCWNDAILSMEKPLCWTGLKDPKRMNRWANVIKSNIDKDEEYHRGYFQIVKDLFSNSRSKKYTSPGCDLNKISKY